MILPVGVVEEHGAHLPLGVDSFAAEVYADAAAPDLEDKGYEVVIAPTISYGVARAAMTFLARCRWNQKRLDHWSWTLGVRSLGTGSIAL